MYGDRRRRRIAAGDPHEVHGAERPGRDGVAHEPVGRVEPAVEADLQAGAGAPRSRPAPGRPRRGRARSASRRRSPCPTRPRRRAGRRGCRCSCRWPRRRGRALASSSSTDARDRHAERRATTCAALGVDVVDHAERSPGTWWASSSACIRPMRPTPSTPMRTTRFFRRPWRTRLARVGSPAVSRRAAPDRRRRPRPDGPLPPRRARRRRRDRRRRAGRTGRRRDGRGARPCRPRAAPYARRRPRALAHPGLEACLVATPTPTHPAVVEAALDAGLHVLCEKPLALDRAERRSSASCAAAWASCCRSGSGGGSRRRGARPRRPSMRGDDRHAAAASGSPSGTPTRRRPRSATRP